MVIYPFQRNQKVSTQIDHQVFLGLIQLYECKSNFRFIKIILIDFKDQKLIESVLNV